ncbi:MAG TPA: LPS export ABC transporter periplasmic protein LptC [Gammaproteobacteria bacterium]|nr:LPS export ABC transporter periplasmic protein LptC [Gammaproteobacteria bacterium]
MLATRNLSFFFLLLTALFLSAWSIFIIYYKKSSSTAADLGKPDAFMEEIVATIIDKQGKPSLKIVSPKMIHYLENDSTEISKPLLTLYRNARQPKATKPWQLSADHARALEGIHQILLWENVVIHHPEDEQDEKTTLLTPTLRVYPDKQFAETADPVTIMQPNTKIHAIGMNADLASGAVKLLSQTRGEYSVQN